MFAGLAYADWIVIGIIVLMTFMGIAQGFLRVLGNFFSRKSFIFAIIVAFFLAGMLASYIPDGALDFIPASARDIATTIAAGIAIAIVITVVFGMIGRGFVKMSNNKVNIVGRIVGGLFMFAQYALIVFALLALVEVFADYDFGIKAVEYITENTVLLSWLRDINPLAALIN